jgi:mannose-6-phosphate isomerase-like protein (cupin superfamily)
MNMYHNSRYHCQWHNPNSWNNNNYNPHHYNWKNNNWSHPLYRYIELRDYGQRPFVVNIEQAAKQNNTYRTALWTGKYFQVTLMSINVGDDIGLEVHPTTDQFIRIEAGQGLVQMGDSQNKLDFQEMAYVDYAIMIPAGKWHNVTNTGNTPLKIYVIYAPPEHPYGTVQETKAITMAARNHHY